MSSQHKWIVVLDFGSQYTQLIARRIREAKVYCEILPYNVSPEKIFQQGVAGIILSGGPASTTNAEYPQPHQSVFQGKLPVLGICYGCQLIAKHETSKIIKAPHREYGPAQMKILQPDLLLKGLKTNSVQTIWMSHEDCLDELPDQFKLLAETDSSPYSVIVDPNRTLYGVQFHPEVTHSTYGAELLKNFVIDICMCKPTWTPDVFIEEAVASIRQQVGNAKVVCGLSGGVDSAVVSLLLDKAIGDQLLAVFVDNGILREGEFEQVLEFFTPLLGDRFIAIDAKNRFINRLKNVEDPEKKRKIIGAEFINVFEEEARKHGEIGFLAQGTLYPDVIESTPVQGPSATIKSHHNVGGLPERMDLKLIEPLRYLFKDEVRQVGKSLNLADEIIWRQPFPGPGLAIRILGEVTAERLQILRQADAIVREEISAAELMRSLWQTFAVLLPVRSVGVMGDERTYESVCAIRAVTSVDAMTADWAKLPYDLLGRISNRISNEVRGINRVVYDISSKPPATIEWE